MYKITPFMEYGIVRSPSGTYILCSGLTLANYLGKSPTKHPFYLRQLGGKIYPPQCLAKGKGLKKIQICRSLPSVGLHRM